MLIHLAALAAVSQLGEQSLPRAQRASFAGQEKVIQLTAAWSSLAPSVASQRPVDAPVIVLPREAVIERQHFVTAATDTELPEPDAAPPAVEPSAQRPHDRAPAPPVETPPRPADQAAAPARPSSPPPSTASTAVPARESAGSEADTRPSFVNNRPPKYPETAVRRGWQGTVLLRIRLGRDGRVLEVQVVQSSGYPLLDAEAAQTVRQWTARPAQRHGQPMETVEVLPIQFELPR